MRDFDNNIQYIFILIYFLMLVFCFVCIKLFISIDIYHLSGLSAYLSVSSSIMYFCQCVRCYEHDRDFNLLKHVIFNIQLNNHRLSIQ